MMISFKKYIFDNVVRNIIKGLKVTEHEYFFFEIFSKFKYFGDILIMLHEE